MTANRIDLRAGDIHFVVHGRRHTALACATVLVACGALREEGERATDGDGPAASSLLPTDASIERRSDDELLAESIGCPSNASVAPRTVDGGPSAETFLELRDEGLRTFHNAYREGVFRDDPTLNACGNRGVYISDDNCTHALLAACSDTVDVGGRSHSCIYILRNIAVREQDRMTSPAGHYVDAKGRCWNLVDAKLTYDTEAYGPVGENRAGRFEVTALFAEERKVLTGSFNACRPISQLTTCE
jgi:hypothetical protein